MSDTIQTKTTLKSWFETGDVPTESQFSDFITTMMSEYRRLRVSLSPAATVNTDVSVGGCFDIALDQNIALANPSGMVDGQSVMWRIKQDGSVRTVTLGNKFRIPSSATTPLAWSEGGSKMDILCAVYNAGSDTWDVVSFIPGY